MSKKTPYEIFAENVEFIQIQADKKRQKSTELFDLEIQEIDSLEELEIKAQGLKLQKSLEEHPWNAPFWNVKEKKVVVFDENKDFLSYAHLEIANSIGIALTENDENHDVIFHIVMKDDVCDDDVWYTNPICLNTIQLHYLQHVLDKTIEWLDFHGNGWKFRD